MRFRRITIFIFFILCSSHFASAGETYTVSSTGSQSDQNVINSALDSAAQAGGGTVYLQAGVYTVNGPVYIGSNTELTGDPDAMIIVSSSTSQWFTGSTGIISCKGSLENVEIHGFQINGNCPNIPASYANTPGHNKDCERCIILHGDSGNYANNILIHDMTLCDSFSDGMYIYYAQGVQCYNNFISNCQHEGIFWSVVLNSVEYGNKIAGITSDCMRLDNCVNCKVYDNILFSYSGTHNNGAYEHGENGMQIGDAGSSHGYDAHNKPTTTTNIEVCNNTFANNGLASIVGGMGENVYIHDNKFIGQAELETMGIPVDVLNGNYTPTNKMSEKVFSSIFDILDVNFVDSGVTNQTADDIQYSVQKTEVGRIAGGIKIVGFKDQILIDNVTYIPDTDSAIVKYEAIKAPSYSWSSSGVSKMDKNVSVKMENGVANATLSVTMHWFKISKDPKTGISHKSHKTATATFNDSMKAPEIFQDPTEIIGTINTYPTYSVVSVPYTGLTQIHYDYNEQSVDHVFMVGEVLQNSNGIKYTSFTRVNYWKGEHPHMGEMLYINGLFDPEKLTVTTKTPYKTLNVTKFQQIKHDMPDDVVAGWFYPSVGVMFMLLYAAWFYLKKIWY